MFVINEFQDENTNRINDKSTEFYHLVPHVLKLGETLPMLNTEEIVKKKIEVVDNLMEIENAYSILQHSENGAKEEKNPIDLNYQKLKADIDVLDKSTEDFKIIEEYVQNTHAKTHSNYKLSIHNVFTIKREKEAKRYKEI